MGIDTEGRFQSNKHPELPPDRIRLNLGNPRSQRALWILAYDYEDIDPELAADIRQRLQALGYTGNCVECDGDLDLDPDTLCLRCASEEA